MALDFDRLPQRRVDRSLDAREHALQGIGCSGTV